MSAGRPRTLMFVTQTHTPWGGIEIWIDEFAEWMRARGWRTVAGLAQGARYSDAAAFAAAHPRLEAFPMDARAGTESARVRAVTQAIRRAQPDVVIPNGIAATYAAVRALKAGGMPLRFVVPLFSHHADTLASVVEQSDVVDDVVVNNRLGARALEHRLGEGARIHHVPQGVRPATRLRQRVPGPLRAAFVGRFEEATKRIADIPRLLDALDREVDLRVYGDGPDRALLGDRVDWRGVKTKDELYEEVYPNLDVLLLFSPSEGDPNAVYEAMQHGVVPVVARYLGYATERVLRDGENAMTFDVGDVGVAAKILAQLDADRDLLDRLGTRAIEAVRGRTDAAMHAAWEAIVSSDSATKRGERAPPRISGAGRLDRFLGARAADALRVRLGRTFAHRSGWEEWPGSPAADPSLRARIETALQSIEAAARMPR